MYGLMIAIGILACFCVLYLYGKKRKIEERFVDFLFYNAIASIAVGFFSAALFQAVYDYIEDPSQGFSLAGKFTFIGGLIGGVGCFLIIYFLFRKKYKARLVDVLSIAPCCILVAHAFGRVGCFFAGCCYGKPTDSFWGVQFPHLPYKVHPTQLYEATFLFVLFAICFILIWKKNFKHNMSLYLIAYGIFRFLIEYLRGDHRGELFGGISPSQFWSILMVALGIALIFLMEWALKRRAKELLALADATVLVEPTETENVTATENTAENTTENITENIAETTTPEADEKEVSADDTKTQEAEQ